MRQTLSFDKLSFLRACKACLIILLNMFSLFSVILNFFFDNNRFFFVTKVNYKISSSSFDKNLLSLTTLRIDTLIQFLIVKINRNVAIVII